MSTPLTERPYKWSHAPFTAAAVNGVPAVSGVYVIAEINRVLGLPVSVLPYYIGQSDNLRRRLLQHCDLRQSHNQDVYLLSDKPYIEFWWTTCSRSDLDLIERHLIRNLQPSMNKIEYKE